MEDRGDQTWLVCLGCKSEKLLNPRTAPEQPPLPGMGHSLGGPGDDHYTALGPIQPLEVAEAWKLPHHLACVLKYLARWERKGGLEDLEKAQFYLRRFIMLQR